MGRSPAQGHAHVAQGHAHIALGHAYIALGHAHIVSCLYCPRALGRSVKEMMPNFFRLDDTHYYILVKIINGKSVFVDTVISFKKS